MSKGQASEASGISRTAKLIAFSILLGTVFCAVLLLIMSVIITTQNVPQSLVEPMSLVALSAGALAAGYICARAMRSKGLVYGALCGIAITFLVLVAGTAFSVAGLGVPAVFRVVFVMLSSMLGGVMGVNTRWRKK